MKILAAFLKVFKFSGKKRIVNFTPDNLPLLK